MLSGKTILLLLALHIQWLASAQKECSIIFSGRIIDENNQPVRGASILMNAHQGQLSDSLGQFRFTGICFGKYNVKVQFTGYDDAVFEISLKGDVTRTIRLTERVTELETVVVQHHDEAGTEHATNFVQLDERQLAESAGKSLGESLREVPGVNSIQTGPGIFKPVIHGVHSQRILILNHGIRQEGQQWGAEHAPEIDPFIASNIVVIKDASAIKYGTDALGGVIVVNPPSLPEQNQTGGMIHTILQGNSRSATICGMLEGGVSKHQGWGWRVQGTAKRIGDFSTPDYILTNTGLQELNFSAAAGYHREKTGFDFFFSHFHTEIGILKGTSIGSLDDLVSAMERRIPAYTSDFSYQISEPRQDVSHNLLKLNGHINRTHGEWRWQYGFQNNNRKEFDMRIGDLSKIPAIDLQLNTHSLDIEWETHHSENRTLSIGTNGMYQVNKNIYGTQRIPFIPNFTNVSAGVFVITKLYFDSWTVDLGCRYDYRFYEVKGYDYKNSFFDDAFNVSNISATAGAVKQLNSRQTLNINLSSSWRPPHVAELYSLGTHQSAAAIEYGLLLNDSTNEVLPITDVNFKTEQALKLVTTYRYGTKKLAWEISPYVNHIFNYLYLRPVGVTKNVRGVYPYFRYTQTDALFIGTDLSATWHVCKFFTIVPQVSLLRASDEGNDDYFVFIPPNRYEVTVRYDRPLLSGLRNFYFESKMKYTARQHRVPRVVTVREIQAAQAQGIDPFASDDSNFDFMAAPSGYFTWNAAVGFSWKRDKTQYDFRVASENILNQRYREYTNRLRYYADDIGRNVIFSIKCIF